MAEGMKRVFQTKLTDVSSSDKEGVGTVRREGDNKYLYCKGAASTARYDIVAIGASYSTAAVSTTTSNYATRVAVAQAAVAASKYGWYQITGYGTVAAANSTSTNAALYLNNSKQANNSAASSPVLNGIVMVGSTSNSSNTQTAFILNPYTGPN